MGFLILLGFLVLLFVANVRLYRRRRENIRWMNNDVDFDDWKGTTFRDSEDDPDSVPIRLE